MGRGLFGCRLCGRLCLDSQRMDGMGHEIAQAIIHQPMARYGGKSLETAGYDAYPIMTCAALRAGVAGVQMRLVLDDEAVRREGGQALADQFDAIFNHGVLPGPRSARDPASSSCMWRLSQTDWPITNTSRSPIRPKTLKLTHCASVKRPEKATYRLMKPAARKNSAQLRLSLFQAASGSEICWPISLRMGLRPIIRPPSSTAPKIQYSTVGFHLMK